MKQEWEKLTDDEILQKRIRDLKLQIAGSEIEPLVNQLYSELDSKGISFHPPCYLTDEWLCPDKVPTIGIPFCLAHPRLRQIEKKAIGSEFQGYYDDSLKELFITHSEQPTKKASSIIKEHRRQIVASVTRWTGHRKYDINRLLNTLARRCDSLGLYVTKNHTPHIIGITALLAAIATNTVRITGRQ